MFKSLLPLWDFTKRNKYLCCAAALAAFGSMTLELVAMRLLGQLTDNPLIWQNAALGAYVFGLGLGGGIAHLLRHRSASKLLYLSQWALGLAALFFVQFVLIFHVFYRSEWFHYDLWLKEGWVRPLWVFSGYVLAGVMALGALAGFDIPLLLRLLDEKSHSCAQAKAQGIGVLLAMGYGGTLVAGLLPFVLGVWVFDPFYRSFFAAFAFIFVGFLVKYSALNQSSLPPQKNLLFAFKRSLAICLWVFLASVAFLLYPASVQWQSKNHAYNHSAWQQTPWGIQTLGPIGFGVKLLHFLNALPRVQVMQSPYQTLSVLDDVNPWVRPHAPWLSSPEPLGLKQFFSHLLKELKEHVRPGKVTTPFQEGVRLMLGGHLQFAARSERYYHEAFAHFPIKKLGKIPKFPCVMGGGDGLLVSQLLRYGDAVTTITLIELDAAVVNLAQNHPEFVKINHHALTHPKVRIILADAYAFVRSFHEKSPNVPKCDAIYLDFPYPYDFDLLRLYSVEFYGALHRAFFAGGSEKALFVALDAPQKEVTINPVLKETLMAAGFSRVLGFASSSENQPGESFILATADSLKASAGSAPAHPLSLPWPFRGQHPDLGGEQRGSGFVHSLIFPQLLATMDLTF